MTDRTIHVTGPANVALEYSSSGLVEHGRGWQRRKVILGLLAPLHLQGVGTDFPATEPIAEAGGPSFRLATEAPSL